MILWRLKTMRLYIMTTAIALLICNCDGFGKVCKCISHSGTKGNEWGSLAIASNESRLNGYECALIYIRGAPGEIVELRFYDINLRKGCQDEFQIFPHLKESMISDMAIPEEVICAENARQFITTNISFQSDSAGTTETNNNIVENNDVDHAYEDNRSVEHKSFNENEVVPIEHGKTLFSSDNVFGLRLNFKNVLDLPNTYFSISGTYRFVDKASFKIDGNLLPTTLCDYQFLPYPQHYGQERKYENTSWRYFYSPRYPAKYPGHIKCAYKFIGRPNTNVDIEFQAIYLSSNTSSSCSNSTEKLIIYDNKIADKVFVIDVLCNDKQNKRISSTGPNLMIEFESSSNRTTNGFSAKYRFIDVEWRINSTAQHKSSRNMSSQQLSTSYVDVDSTKQSQLKLQSKIENVTNTSEANVEHKQRNTSICPPGSGANCDIVLHSSTSKNGSIQSPLFPGPYPSRTFCRFEFQGNGRQRVQIKFTEFTLPSSEGDDCEQSDTLSVLMKIKGKYEPVETLCGDALPKPLMSNGPLMLLEFRGRQSGKGNRGFKADFIFLENFGIISGRQIPDNECSFVYNSSFETSGWFHSPNFPGAYPRNIECNYFFHGRTMERVHIRFTYFDVEGIFPCDEDSSSDSVEFSNFNSVDRKFQKYCSKIAKGFAVKSDGKFFRITFRSNDRLDGTGFRASYNFEIEKPTTEIPILASDSLNSSSGLHALNDLVLYNFAILSIFPIANVVFWINGL